MAIDFTKSQENAIEASLGNYLVSASAGSGKTAVLTQRVFKLLSEGTKLSELLILTFTNLAAAQMRDKIRPLLLEGDEKVKEVASSLDAANIQTFDAFALNIVKKYYYILGLSSDISFVDQSIINIEQKKALNEILEAHYEAHNQRVLNLISDYCLKNNNDLIDYIIKLSNKFDLKEDKNSYLNSYIQDHFDKKIIVDELNQYVQNAQIKIADQKEKILNSDISLYEKYYQSVLDYTEPLLSAKNYKEFYDALNLGLKIANKPKDLPKESNEYASVEILKTIVKTYKDSLLWNDEEEVYQHYLGTKDNVETIISLIKELDEKIDSFKYQHSVYTFTDVFKFALKIVSVPKINKELKNKYKYIMVDEYQDTSDLQETLLNKIANDNVYVVGDIKQSIYRFRNANCEIFLNKFNSYKGGPEGTKIELAENFRSRKEVVDFVNDVFSPLMTKDNTGLDYESEHKMNNGNHSFEYGDTTYESEVIQYERDKNITNPEKEAELIAWDILTKINSGFKVCKKNKKTDKNELLPMNYGDIAIISRSKTDFDIYRKIFNDYKIPLYIESSKSIKDNNLTLTLKNIIELLYKHSINQIGDSLYHHSFLSVLRSFLIRYSDEKIENVAFIKDYEKHDLFKLLEEIKIETEKLSLEDKIEAIIFKFDIYSKLSKIGNISQNISLLEYYRQVAISMDKMGYTLEDFRQYFEDLDKYDVKTEYKPSDDVENCVKLLSIHASKGLQFKVCYFPQIYKEFNFDDVETHLMYDNKFGILLPNLNCGNIVTFPQLLTKNKQKREIRLEELRLFYVALTRAEEKIILLENTDPHKGVAKSFDTAFRNYDYFKLSGVDPKVITPSETKNLKSLEELECPPIKINERIKMSDEVIVDRHASKELDGDVDETLLALGNKYHYYLELVDFNTLDTSFIKDENDRKKISNFLANPLFKNMKDANVMHEYPFYDEEANVRGVIDLLVEYSDHIDIIDFKLSHIDDELYEKQLQTYKNYIAKISKKPIRMYLTGIMSLDVKEVI